MGILNKESRTDVYFDLDVEFMDELETADQSYKQIAMVDKTNKPLKKYKWMEFLAKMVKWKGNREMFRLKGAGHEVSNEDWGMGIEVSRDDIEDDSEFGQVAARIRDLALLGPEAMNNEVIDWYVNGFTEAKGTCYDGQYLYDTDHTIAADGSGDVISNLGTAAFSATALDDALIAIAGWTDPHGRKLKIKMTHIMHGPSLRASIRDVLLIDTKTGGGKNPHFELVIPIEVPEIEGDEWFLIAAGKRVKPVILQIRREPTLSSPSNSMNDSTAFHTKDYEFGTEATFGCGYGPWFYTWASNATT